MVIIIMVIFGARSAMVKVCFWLCVLYCDVGYFGVGFMFVYVFLGLVVNYIVDWDFSFE